MNGSQRIKTTSALALMVIPKDPIWLISVKTIPVSFRPHLAYFRMKIKSEVNSNCNVEQRPFEICEINLGQPQFFLAGPDSVIDIFIALGVESLLMSNDLSL